MLKRVLKKIETSIHSHPAVLWTGNDYHIYHAMEGFILEEEDVFTKFFDKNGKDLASKFVQQEGAH